MGTNASQRRPREGSGAGQSDSDTRPVLNELRLLVRALRVSSREAEKVFGISGAQLFVLQTLKERGSASVGDLALATHTDQSSVSVVVSRLVSRRLVARTESKADARRVEIRLTAAGRSLLHKAPQPTQLRLIRALRALPRGTRKQLRRALHELVGAMGIDGEPRMFFEDEPRRPDSRGQTDARA
jgi:DNA-binding MarR family transcriptional regulator